MAGLPIVTNGGELFLNGTSMHKRCWGAYDIKPVLLGTPVLRDAEDPVIEGIDGRPGFDDEVDETTYSIDMWMSGEVGPDEEPLANPIVALRRNRDALRELVPQGRIIDASIELHDDDDTVIEDQVKVQFEFVNVADIEVPMALHVTVPGGWFGASLEGGS